ncbi:MAG: hypothetical protein KGJ06_03280 [Pseudomonadota bacterium]|nr:hypothetical protein [Pseudomonadota bacterium]
MNAQQKELYARFREHFRIAAEHRPGEARGDDWIIQAYDDPQAFIRIIENFFKEEGMPFHNWNEFGRWLQALIDIQTKVRSHLSDTLQRIKEQGGLNYTDIEELRYELLDDSEEGHAR